jgi:tRNA nucleotidyltransferase (CCA-adding enzyme)
MTSLQYLNNVLSKYQAKNLLNYSAEINVLKQRLQAWANGCFVAILDTGSRAKGTAIHLSSDVDYFVSLTSGCNGTLSEIYNLLCAKLETHYRPIRKQNVSVRIKLRDLEVDITAGKRQDGYQNYHSIYKSKTNTWTQTNVTQHNRGCKRKPQKFPRTYFSNLSA